MRNLLDKASIAQSLDGARLMGCLLYPGRGYSLIYSTTRPRQHNTPIMDWVWCIMEQSFRRRGIVGKQRKGHQIGFSHGH